MKVWEIGGFRVTKKTIKKSGSIEKSRENDKELYILKALLTRFFRNIDDNANRILKFKYRIL